MVFLAITPAGLAAALREAENLRTSVWCGSDALSELDFAELGAGKLTRFAYALGARDPLVGRIAALRRRGK